MEVPQVSLDLSVLTSSSHSKTLICNLKLFVTQRAVNQKFCLLITVFLMTQIEVYQFNNQTVTPATVFVVQLQVGWCQRVL